MQIPVCIIRLSVVIFFSKNIVCIHAVCVSSPSSYFITGSYNNIGSIYLTYSQPVYKMVHPCGDKFMYFNTRFNKLIIADEVITDQTDGALSFNAQCMDEAVEDPLLCSKWSIDDLVVSNDDECTALCGSNNAACSPRPFITVSGSEGDVCNGEFAKMSYMDIYESDSGYYWFQNDGNWICSNELSKCDGSTYLVYAQMTDEEMRDAMECGMFVCGN